MRSRKLTAYARTLAVGALLGVLGTPGLVQAATADPTPQPSDTSGGSDQPPDRSVYRGWSPQYPRYRERALRAAGVFVVDATSAARSTGGSEPSIAVNPERPDEIAITRFGGSAWNNKADLLFSRNGGRSWKEERVIPVPPGVPGTAGCPCDQTIDYGRDGRLYGTFLTANGGLHVVTGSTTDPTRASKWQWNGNPAQLTSGNRNNVDQPWLLVNRDPNNRRQDNVYVAYDDFGANPQAARVAVSYGADPVDFTADNKAGTEAPLAGTNPGLRLATDHRNGTVYALYEQTTGAGVQPKNVTYKLNRSTDGGATWTLNGNPDGLTVDTVPSFQWSAGAPYKFGGVNALIGGVDHAAVDPSNGDVYVVYGEATGGGPNRIKIRRLTDNGSGGLTVGPAHDVSTSTNAALPSVAVLSDGTVGVLYDTFEGLGRDNAPIFSAHLARSKDHGVTFSDVVLQTFQTVGNDGNPRQRVLGDYQQLKAVDDQFFGVFAGNFSGAVTGPPTDAIYFSTKGKHHHHDYPHRDKHHG